MLDASFARIKEVLPGTAHDEWIRDLVVATNLLAEELHQVLVGGRTGGLDEKNILPANVFIDLHVGLTIWKTGDFGVGQTGSDLVGNPLGEGGVGVPGKKFHGRR
jgi:hypothetical protein